MPISEVYNGDCMDYMKGFEDKFFDLAIVDPPYGLGLGSRGAGDYSRKWTKYSRNNDKKWDESIPDEQYFTELFRISKNQVIWGANYMTEYLPPSMGWICWYKTDEVKGRDFGEFELAFTSFKKAARHYEEKPFLRNGQRIHPTQKPIALYQWILETYAKQGDKILDTHLGSQSSRIAAYKLGFDFWGSEIDKEYFDKGNERFKKAISEPLFDSVKTYTEQKLF